LVFPVETDLDHGFCALRFERLDEVLENRIASGVLGAGGWGDVKWLAVVSQWVTSWGAGTDLPGVDVPELRVAFFPSDGGLAGPPVRNAASGAENLRHPVRIAAGDGGISLFTPWGSLSDRLVYLRTDLQGVAVAPVGDVLTTGDHLGLLGPYDAVWTDDGFAVLFSGLGWPAVICLQHLARVD
jgi:hypothetical protein